MVDWQLLTNSGKSEIYILFESMSEIVGFLIRIAEKCSDIHRGLFS